MAESGSSEACERIRCGFDVSVLVEACEKRGQRCRNAGDGERTLSALLSEPSSGDHASKEDRRTVLGVARLALRRTVSGDARRERREDGP